MNDNIKSKIVEFNQNEIKYLKDFGSLRVEDNKYISNYFIINKLYNGEFIIASRNIRFSTIQSLVRYTKQQSDIVIKWVDKIFKDGKKSKDLITNRQKSTIEWSLKSKIYVIQNRTRKRLKLNSNYFNYMSDVLKMTYSQILEITHYVMNRYSFLKNYIIEINK